MRSSLTLWRVLYVAYGERPTGVVVQGPMTTRPALLALCALSSAWIPVSTVYLYSGVKEEVEHTRPAAGVWASPWRRKPRLHSRGQALGQVLGDDRDLQFALLGNR